MSNPIKGNYGRSVGSKPAGIEDLVAKAERHPVKSPGDVCIGKVPAPGQGEVVVWSDKEAGNFCRIAGYSARKIGYLPWQDVKAFLKDRRESAAPVEFRPDELKARSLPNCGDPGNVVVTDPECYAGYAVVGEAPPSAPTRPGSNEYSIRGAEVSEAHGKSITENDPPCGGTVVELREIRPPVFFWETLREVLPPGGLKPKKR